MNLMHALHALLGQHSQATQQHSAPAQQQVYTRAQQQQMTPVGQPIPQGMMDSFSPQTRQLAELYQQNPQDPRVMGLDPKMFGYAPDNTVRMPHLSQLIHGGSMQGYPGMETPMPQPSAIQPTEMGQYGQGSAIQGPQNAGFTLGQGGANPQFSTPRFRGGNINF